MIENIYKQAANYYLWKNVEEYLLGKVSLKECLDAIDNDINEWLKSAEGEKVIKEYYDDFANVKEIENTYLKWSG